MNKDKNMNILIFSDVHILEQDLPEIEVIFDELLQIKEKYSINKVIMAGDTFERFNPNPKELDCFAKFLIKLNLPVILIVAKSHESISATENILNHFGILKSNLHIFSEYKDEKKLYVGHFIVKQSSKNYGGTVDKVALKKYKNVLLGHGHNFEIIKPNICQLGSVRFCDFGEDEDVKKRVAICTDYKGNKERWQFLELKSPYPMINIELNGRVLYSVENSFACPDSVKKGKDTEKDQSSIFEGESAPKPRQNLAISQLISKLDQIDPKTKIRIIFKDYELWRDFLPYYNKYKQKFVVFREKKEFLNQFSIENTTEKKEKTSLKESFLKFFKANKVEKKIQAILLKEI